MAVGHNLDRDLVRKAHPETKAASGCAFSTLEHLMPPG